MGYPSPMMGRFGSNQMDPRNAGAMMPGDNPYLKNLMALPSPNPMGHPSGFPGMPHHMYPPMPGMPHFGMPLPPFYQGGSPFSNFPNPQGFMPPGNFHPFIMGGPIPNHFLNQSPMPGAFH